MSALGMAIALFMIIFGIGFTRQMWTEANAPWFAKALAIFWTLGVASFCI
jgi:hypothetical protein